MEIVVANIAASVGFDYGREVLSSVVGACCKSVSKLKECMIDLEGEVVGVPV